MMSPRKLCLLALALLFSTAGFTNSAKITQKSGQELVLNGMGAWKDSGNDIFFAALYLPSKSADVGAIAYGGIPKRFELRIATRSIRPRRFAQMWGEYIAINNDREEWKASTADMIKFNKFFNKKLVRGDQVVLDFIPNTGLHVSINGVEKGVIKNIKLMQLIVYAWLGERPITPQFKAGLMGANSAVDAIQLQEDYEALKPKN
jgi:hypothetical protein